jgi:replicative DNA helicase
MSHKEITQRIAAISSHIELSKFVDGSITMKEQKSCDLAIKKEGISILIYDCSFLTISDLRTTIKQITNKHKIKIVIVDYLQLLEDNSKKGDSREVEISKISRGLKLIAKESELPIIALSQLSRESEKREGPPKMSDLRGSGSIEQDADCITFLHTPNKSKPSITELIVEKNRNGPCGSIEITFSSETTKFTSR